MPLGVSGGAAPGADVAAADPTPVGIIPRASGAAVDVTISTAIGDADIAVDSPSDAEGVIPLAPSGTKGTIPVGGVTEGDD